MKQKNINKWVQKILIDTAGEDREPPSGVLRMSPELFRRITDDAASDDPARDACLQGLLLVSTETYVAEESFAQALNDLNGQSMFFMRSVRPSFCIGLVDDFNDLSAVVDESDNDPELDGPETQKLVFMQKLNSGATTISVKGKIIT